MMFAMYRDAFRIIKESKFFILLFLLSYFSSIPRSNDADFSLWVLCGYWPVTLTLSLYLELYLIGMVVKHKNLLDQKDSPSKLAEKYIWKGLLVGVVALLWLLIILGLPYILIGVVRDLTSGIMLWSINFIWCVLQNLIFFSLFNLGMIILTTRHSVVLETPVLGFVEMFKNFRHYFKIYILTTVVSYSPLLVSVMLVALGQGIESVVTNSPYSLNPYESAYGLLFHSDLNLFSVLIFAGLFMLQKVVMTLSYFSRPNLSASIL